MRTNSHASGLCLALILTQGVGCGDDGSDGKGGSSTNQTTTSSSAGGNADGGTGSSGGADTGCSDGIQNGKETDVDCGGPTCAPCSVKDACETGSDCETGSCDAKVCQPASCNDKVKNQEESDVDCGGPCAKCPTGAKCVAGTDCLSQVCVGFCAAPSCDDGVKNEDETGVDCGGSTCGACDNSGGCKQDSDCLSDYCAGGVCAPWASSLSKGSYARHVCAVRMDGSVDCWGSNSDGQLGVGTTVDAPSPVAVIGLADKVKELAAGHAHTCALLSGGGVNCWGANESGQLGNSTTEPSASPTQVTALTSGVIGIATGGYHSCAVYTDGSAACWGRGKEGQLGNGTETNFPVTIKLTGLHTDIASISCGEYHTCALTNDGAVYCWGDNGSGQLGTTEITSSSVPVHVPGLSSGVVAISSGDFHTCALTNIGQMYCWGADDSGQLGNQITEPMSASPSPVKLLQPVVAISAGAGHTCAITTSHYLACWGDDAYGELGFQSSTDVDVPTFGQNWGKGSSVSGAFNLTCAITEAGGVECVGAGGFLGNGQTTNSATPVQVSKQ